MYIYSISFIQLMIIIKAHCPGSLLCFRPWKLERVQPYASAYTILERSCDEARRKIGVGTIMGVRGTFPYCARPHSNRPPP